MVSRKMKHDHVAFMPRPDAATSARNPAAVFARCDEQHPHSAP
ncbi:transposase [Caballeronia insecticola]|uniref:Transposase n=1 Tax=Caballeronia insecticola TaxID=758793 RepID=R4X111_9BURK|nr:transposase [Caballeronia insecticola]